MRIGEIWKRKEKWRNNLSHVYSGESLEVQMGKVILTKVEYDTVTFNLIHPEVINYDAWDRKSFINEFEKVYE